MIYNLGRVVPLFKGNYDAATTYGFLDVVYYDNSSFVALDTTTGNLPTDTTHWLPVALKGLTQNPTPAQMQQIISEVKTYMESTDFVLDPDYVHIDVINNLTSTSTTNALSANQGKVLNETIDDVSHSVSDLNNRLKTEESVDVSNTTNGFWGFNQNKNGTYYDTITYVKTCLLSVSAGQQYRAKSYLGGASMAQIIFFDANGVNKGWLNKGDSSIHDDTFTVPSDVVEMAFAGYSSSQYPFELYKKVYIDFNEISNSVSSMESSVGTLDEIKNKTIDIIEGKNLYNWRTDNSNGYINSTGSKVNSADGTYKYATVEIEPDTYYYLQGRDCNKVIGCLDETMAETSKMKVLIASTGGTRNDYYLPNEMGTGSNTSGQFKTPSTAKYVQFNVKWTTNDDSETAMLWKIGTSYIAGQTTIDYEPYGYFDAKIKESALPEGIGNEEKPLKILLIGSSHGMNTISQLPWICANSTHPLNIEVGNVYVGSLSLQNVCGDIQEGVSRTLKYFKKNEEDGTYSWTSYTKTFPNIIKHTDWDFISIQRSASDDELWFSTQKETDEAQAQALSSNPVSSVLNIYRNMPSSNPHYNTAEWWSHTRAMQYVLDMIRANATNNPKIIMPTGFADPSEGITSNQTNNIIVTIKEMKEQFGIDFVPTAIAIRNARNTFLRYYGNFDLSSGNSNNQLCYDSQHLDYGIGCYVISACLLEYICRKVGWSIINLDGYGSKSELQSFITAANDKYIFYHSSGTVHVDDVYSIGTTNYTVDYVYSTTKFRCSSNPSNTAPTSASGTLTFVSGDSGSSSSISYTSWETYEAYTAPNEETMIAAKACAMCAVDTPDAVSTTLQNRFKWHIGFNLSNGLTVADGTKHYSGNSDVYNVEFNNAPTITSITSRGWDRTGSTTTLTSGTDYSVSGNVLTINNVQGDIVITAN